MNKLLTTIAAIAAVTISAQARIGETFDQAVERYGQPVEKHDSWAKFRKGEFQIFAAFYQGKIEAIEYSKVTGYNDYWKMIETAELSDVEIENFLKANHDGEWKASGRDRWLVSDLVACKKYLVDSGDWTKSYHRLFIWTYDAGQRSANKIKAQQTAAQAGF